MIGPGALSIHTQIVGLEITQIFSRRVKLKGFHFGEKPTFPCKKANRDGTVIAQDNKP